MALTFRCICNAFQFRVARCRSEIRTSRDLQRRRRNLERRMSPAERSRVFTHLYRMKDVLCRSFLPLRSRATTATRGNGASFVQARFPKSVVHSKRGAKHQTPRQKKRKKGESPRNCTRESDEGAKRNTISLGVVRVSHLEKHSQ